MDKYLGINILPSRARFVSDNSSLIRSRSPKVTFLNRLRYAVDVDVFSLFFYFILGIITSCHFA